jgi:hypothetical protein
MNWSNIYGAGSPISECVKRPLALEDLEQGFRRRFGLRSESTGSEARCGSLNCGKGGRPGSRPTNGGKGPWSVEASEQPGTRFRAAYSLGIPMLTASQKLNPPNGPVQTVRGV